MGADALRLLHALALAAIATALAACSASLASVADEVGVDRGALVVLSDTFAVAARMTGSGVELVGFRASEAGSWSTEPFARASGGRMTAHLITYGGDTGEVWNSFFFGTAPAGASRVVLDGVHGQGGEASGGAWVIAFREKDLRPDQLAWEALDAAGIVLESGTGITP